MTLLTGPIEATVHLKIKIFCCTGEYLRLKLRKFAATLKFLSPVTKKLEYLGIYHATNGKNLSKFSFHRTHREAIHGSAPLPQAAHHP